MLTKRLFVLPFTSPSFVLPTRPLQLVNVPEYYLWNAETSILQQHGAEIAHRLFGFQTPATQDLLRKDNAQHTPQDTRRVCEELNSQQKANGNGHITVGESAFNSRLSSAESAGGSPTLVELGAGSLRKTIHLLRALKDLPVPQTHYYALDLDKAELNRTLSDLYQQLATSADDPNTVLSGKVDIRGIWATYDQGLDLVGKDGLDAAESARRCLMWLGSSIGNFERRDAAEFLKKCADTALRPGDTMLVGIDRRNTPRDVELAYNDPSGVTRSFIMNGLKHADRLLGGNVLSSARFEYHDRYNVLEGRHESYYRSLEEQDLSLPDGSTVHLAAGELIHIERSYKYSERETLDALDHAGLRVVQKWSTPSSPHYDLWLLEKPPFHFESTRLFTGWRQSLSQGLSVAQAHNSNGSHEYDADGGASSLAVGSRPQPHISWGSWGIPTASEWSKVWSSWDTITLTMISRKLLHQKPIDLRHICLFYIGHIPAFVDIMLMKTLPDLEPIDAHYNNIFERGIDPHVDDPTQCHAHSEVPQKEEDWPRVEEILAYRELVMKRVEDIYHDVASGKRGMDRRLARTLRMTLEHIELHQETLLYMLAQSPNTLPPKDVSLPDWASLTRHWDEQDLQQGGQEARESLLYFKADVVDLGHHDDDAEDLDIRTTRLSKDVSSLNAQLAHPEFGWDNETPVRKVQTGAFSIMATPVNNEQYASFLKATGSSDYPSSWIQDPSSSTSPFSVRTVFGPVPMSVARLWPVQSSGSQLRKYAAWKGGRLPTHAELRRFLDASTSPQCVDRPGSNVGFRHWHPVPASLPRVDGDGLLIPGHNGGVWEWTSTPFMDYEGFRPSDLYPGYSADFFDGKHDVVLGGSWATTPSVAGRRTVCNTYQREYPYSFIGGRVLFDEETVVKGPRSPVRK